MPGNIKYTEIKLSKLIREIVVEVFCVYSKIFYLKENDKTSHWVGHPEFKPLDLESFYEIKNNR